MIGLILGFIIYWLIWGLICNVLLFKITYPVKHYIYMKLKEEPMGWTISWGKICIVRINFDGTKEFKIFLKDK